jgi:hypothetical protein
MQTGRAHNSKSSEDDTACRVWQWLLLLLLLQQQSDHQRSAHGHAAYTNLRTPTDTPTEPANLAQPWSNRLLAIDQKAASRG